MARLAAKGKSETKAAATATEPETETDLYLVILSRWSETACHHSKGQKNQTQTIERQKLYHEIIQQKLAERAVENSIISKNVFDVFWFARSAAHFFDYSKPPHGNRQDSGFYHWLKDFPSSAKVVLCLNGIEHSTNKLKLWIERFNALCGAFAVYTG